MPITNDRLVSPPSPIRMSQWRRSADQGPRRGHRITSLRTNALICLSLLLGCFTTGSGSAQSISMASLASHKLGYSGATVSIRERNRHWPVADRTFILVGANGRTRTLPLQKGGGKMGNASLNLYAAGQDRYLVVSERDCVEFDPVEVTARYCSARPPCDHGDIQGLQFIGRFDWMNGFDPPKGRFQFAFRYLPAEDAVESGSCPAKPVAGTR